MKTPKNQLRAFLFGGLLPVVLFTVVEEKYGTVAGLVAGMIFGIGEISWERYSQKKVETMTWIGNGLILVLGAVSLISTDGIWFKLQPAILEAVFGVVLVGSVFIRKPFMVLMGEKQGMFLQVPDVLHRVMKDAMASMTLRLGLFFFAHSALATWAAFYWSTRAWALLKGVGVTVSMIVYVIIESLVLRSKLASARALVGSEILRGTPSGQTNAKQTQHTNSRPENP